MAYARYGQHDKSFICDDVEDLKNLPFATIGSTCYVIANASKYIINSKGEWVRQTYGDINVPEGGGSDIDLSKYATIEYVDREIDNLETNTDIKIEQIREEVNIDNATFDGGEI